MVKEKITRNRIVVLTLALLLSCFILLPFYMYQYCGQFPPGEYYDRPAAVVFSGVNQSGLVACPWILNETDGSVVGENLEFRD